MSSIEDDGEPGLARLEGRRGIAEDPNASPTMQLMVLEREMYARQRARGLSVAKASKIAGVNLKTAERYYEPKGSKFSEDGAGGAIQRRIAWLRQAAQSSGPTLGELTLKQERLIDAALADGKFEVARRAILDLKEEIRRDSGNGSEDEVLEVDGEEIALLLSQKEDDSEP